MKHFTPVMIRFDATYGWLLRNFGVALFLIPLLVGCNKPFINRDFNQGVIEYEIVYSDSDSPMINPNLRPTRMTIRFNGNSSINTVEALSGGLSLSFIQNAETNQSKTLIRLLNKKLSYQEPIVAGQPLHPYQGLPPLRFVFHEDTQEFLGFLCHRATAYFDDSSQASFDILYTKEIDVEKPNRNTPFEPIDGVLLKFNMVVYNQRMSMVATSLQRAQVSREEFQIPTGYEPITRETLLDVVSLLQ